MNVILKPFIAFVLVGFLPSAASSKSPVNNWFCSSLSTSFDPKAAIAAFPLEKLPPAVEEREEKTDKDGDKTTWVETEAEGEKFTVTYRYAFNNDDVTDPYGFSLTIHGVGDARDAMKPQMESWLAELGTPLRSGFGSRSVYSGPPLYEGGEQVFSMQYSPVVGNYSANWFNRGDIRYAADLCK